MKIYKEMSDWWYLAVLIGTLGMAIGTSYAADSGLPWWGVIGQSPLKVWIYRSHKLPCATVALLFAWFFIPIIGTLYCTVGYAPSIENMIQMLGGALIPGKPVANMYCELTPCFDCLCVWAEPDNGMLSHLVRLQPRRASHSSAERFEDGMCIAREILRSLWLIARLKGQYTKVPPRVTFMAQTIGAVVVCCPSFLQFWWLTLESRNRAVFSTLSS